MRNNRAKFDKAEYDKSNPIAIEAMEGWLAEKIPDLIVDSTGISQSYIMALILEARSMEVTLELSMR